MQNIYVGIDISKDKFDLAISDKNFSEVIYKKFSNDTNGFKRFKVYLEKTTRSSNISIAMESTGIYSLGLADFLYKNKYKTYVVNPSIIKSFGKGNMYNAKTDKIDSEIILKFIVHNQNKLYPYKSPSDAERLLKGYMKRRASLMTQKQQETNKLKMISTGLKDIERSHKRIIKFLEKEIKMIENKMKELIKKDKEMFEKKKEITQVRGVGDFTAYTMLSMVPELGKIKNKKITALIGLAPYVKESGKQKWKSHIKKGRQDVKTTLYMAATVSIRYNEKMKEFYERLTSKGKPFKVAITAVMRKLLVIMNAIIKSYIEKNEENKLSIKNTQFIT